MQDTKPSDLDELELDEPSEEQLESSTPDVSETPVNPKQPLNLGRHLAFLVEDAAIQMAAVSHFGRYRRVIELNKHYLTHDQVKSHERLPIVSKTINDFIDKHKRPFTVISLAISGRETALRSFLMPALKKGDLGSAIDLEAKNQLPFPIDDCTYDFRPTYRVKSGNRELLNISLLAATRRFINEKLEPFGEHRQVIEHIYHAPDIVGRLLPYVEEFDEFENYTALNIGQSQSEIAFYRGSSLEFYNVISIGSSMLGKNPDKISFSFLAESLATEIQTSIDFYTGRFSRTVSSQIYVYGNLAYSNDIINGLKSSMGYTFQRFPIEKISFLPERSLEKFEAEIPVCLPAFAAASCPAGMADLLPPETKLIHRNRRIDNLAKVALAILLLTLLGGWSMMQKAISIKQNKLITLNRQVNDFVSSEAFRTYNLIKQQIAVDQAYLESAREVPSFLSLNLKELSLLTPKEVKLLNMQFRPNDEGENLILQGIVRADHMPPEVILAEFIENLVSSPFYDQVVISRHVKKEIKKGFEIDFTLKCRGLI